MKPGDRFSWTRRDRGPDAPRGGVVLFAGTLLECVEFFRLKWPELELPDECQLWFEEPERPLM